jgi:hypothetical protein
LEQKQLGDENLEVFLIEAQEIREADEDDF